MQSSLKERFFIAAALILVVCGGFSTSLARPGERDVSFNLAGTYSYSASTDYSVSDTTATAIQSDGKIVMAYTANVSVTGGVTDGVCAIRLNADGTVDLTFGSQGVFNLNIGNFEHVTSTLIQPDGKILIGGTRYSGVTGNDFYVVRLLPNGVPDNTFDGNGLAVVTMIDNSDEYAYDMKLLPDGKILIGGQSNLVMFGNDFSWAVAKMNPDGSLDSSFGSGGKVSLSYGGLDESVMGLAIVNGNEPVLCGYATPVSTKDIILTKLTANGSVDTSWQGGAKLIDVGGTEDVCDSIVHLKKGGFVVGGRSSSGSNARAVLIGINEDGTIRAEFGTNGFVRTTSLGTDANSIIEQPEGKLLLLSSVGTRAQISRFRSSGVLDTGFGSGGTTSVPLGTSGTAQAGRVELQPDGKIVAVAKLINELSGKFCTIRVLGGTVSNTGIDFDGDEKSDISVYRPTNNSWYVDRSTLGFTGAQFGAPSDVLTPADFTGDGKTDIAVWRPDNGTWYILRSEDSTFSGASFGKVGDIPVPADYDGDGKADLAVFRPGPQAVFYLQRTTAGFAALAFGIAEDKPAIADFDGDGKSDICVFRPSLGDWYRINSSTGLFNAVHFGASGDLVVPGDHTGDGKADLAVFRPSTGVWYVLRSEDSTFYGVRFGDTGDIPSPGDFDGDGKLDLAVFRVGANPTDQGIFFVQGSSAGFSAFSFGLSGDRPVPSSFVW